MGVRILTRGAREAVANASEDWNGNQ